MNNSRISKWSAPLAASGMLLAALAVTRPTQAQDGVRRTEFGLILWNGDRPPTCQR